MTVTGKEDLLKFITIHKRLSIKAAFLEMKKAFERSQFERFSSSDVGKSIIADEKITGIDKALTMVKTDLKKTKKQIKRMKKLTGIILEEVLVFDMLKEGSDLVSKVPQSVKKRYKTYVPAKKNVSFLL